MLKILVLKILVLKNNPPKFVGSLNILTNSTHGSFDDLIKLSF